MDKNIKHIHLLGICGTAVGSFAGLLKEAGYKVTGSDSNVYPPMSTQLADMGVSIFSGYSADNLKIRPDLVIIGNVITRNNPEAVAVLEQGLPYLSMPDALGKFFLEKRHSIVVAGTHGKTTTSTLMAWLLESCGENPGFLIGGVAKNFGKSYRLTDSKYFVVEGDEYDTAFFDKGPKFLHYRPQSVILGTVEFDHADIYKDLAHVMSSFEKLLKIIPKDGLCLACVDAKNTAELMKHASCRLKTFGVSTNADYRPQNIVITEKGTTFDLCGERYDSPLFGEHNLQNTAAALGLCLELGLNPLALKKGLATFQSVAKRQEVKGEVGGVTVIDDFAHHPTAMAGVLAAMRGKYPGRRIWGVFEPRSNTSRRNVFQNELKSALASADVAIISGINNPGKIPEGERLNPERLIAELVREGHDAHYVSTTDQIIDFIIAKARPGDVVVTMSNGAFDDIHARLIERLALRIGS